MNLREFLKSKKALTAFKEGYKLEQKTHNNLGPLSEKGLIVNKLSPEKYLKEHGNKTGAIDVFSWGKVKPGFAFWNKLSSEWDNNVQ